MSLPKKIGLAIGLFAVVGVGLGLSGYISINAATQTLADGNLQDAGGFVQAFVYLIALQSAFVVFLLGSVVATVTGSRIADEASSLKEAMLANGAASFFGFYVMVGIALVIMLAAISSGDATGGGTTGGGGGGGGVEMRQFIRPVIQIGVPTGLVGTAAGGIFERLR